MAEKIWIITFGQKYARESHPVSNKIHPNSVISVKAPNQETARAHAFRIFGKNWSNVRELDKNYEKFYPGGIIGQINKNNGRLTIYPTE